MAEDKTHTQLLARLRQDLLDRFNDQELRDLCFDLGIEYDDLPPGGRADKARELVAYCERRRSLAELEQRIQAGPPRPRPISSLPPALHQLKPPPADFTGRADELAELLSAVRQGGVTISGLHGLGGVGKTALAYKLAEQLAPSYPDAQLVVELAGAGKQPLSPSDAMARVIRAYHPTAQLPAGEAELRGLYLSVLHGQRALLLLDDASGATQVEPLLPPASCILLVTSRQHFTLPGLRSVNLDVLPPADAHALLLRIAPRIGQDAPALAQLCGYLPLALRLTASALAERVDTTPADYVRRLTDATQRLRLTGVEASLTLSYDLLSQNLQALWRQLAVFPASFDRAAAAAVWALDADAAADAAGDALSELVCYSLVDYADRYRLHDLARLFAEVRLAEDERHAARLRHAQHYEQVLRSAKELYLQGGESILRGLALFDAEWANIQAGQAWAASSLSPSTGEEEQLPSPLGRGAGGEGETLQLCSDYPDAGAYVLDLRLHPRDHIRWLEAALQAARQLKDRSREGVRLGYLGLIYSNLGQVRQAIPFYEQALVIARELKDKRNEGTHLGNLGIAYADLGETRRAIEFYEQWLAITRDIGDRRGEGQALGNLGVAYADLGETRRTIEFYEKAKEIAIEIGDRRNEGAWLGNLGIAYADLGEPRRAIEYHEQALVIDREIGDRRGEGNALGNLGSAYFTLREHQHAVGYYEKQRAIAQEIGDRRGEGNALWGLAICFEAAQDLPQATTHAEAALAIFVAIESPSAQTMHDMIAKWRGRGASDGLLPNG